MQEEIVREEVRDPEQLEAEARAKADISYLEAIWADEILINATENIIIPRTIFFCGSVLDRYSTGPSNGPFLGSPAVTT